MTDIEEMRRMFDESTYALYLGMKLVELSRGYAKVKLEVKEDFLTWDNLVQGGLIASLIDQAFGCAINTLDKIYVAIQLSINYLAAAGVGDTLYAEAKVLHAGKTLGVSDMVVTNSEGKKIARATGTSVSRGVRS
jgi:acyl-CoA thioesterase